MHLLLVSATVLEIKQTAQWLHNRLSPSNSPIPGLLYSGIGQLQTSYRLTKEIHNNRPDLVIQAGIGGSSEVSDIGKVYAIQSEEIADLGAMEKNGFRNIFDLGLDDPQRYPFQQGKLVNPYSLLLDWSGIQLREGITVNEIKPNKTQGKQRSGLPVVESMEGAALHYVCLMEKIPFLQIRSVSNEMGERDKSRWDLKSSLENLNSTLIAIIQKLETADENIFRI